MLIPSRLATLTLLAVLGAGAVTAVPFDFSKETLVKAILNNKLDEFYEMYAHRFGREARELPNVDAQFLPAEGTERFEVMRDALPHWYPTHVAFGRWLNSPEGWQYRDHLRHTIGLRVEEMWPGVFDRDAAQTASQASTSRGRKRPASSRQ
ncbi:uncharacterized protein PFL1_05961 [Pseudozyma flocculosa PF-1]|uniref:Uncharacterized protein n=2 Tax=Pseudozyma flocculosa TaxID=84751 RepID=A0A5C3F1H4_9BASI|nr:uncharacterized protein PFL1_05961 [Pseudozyma flocculosa PF-1]EPQ26640.1 hypothetical protein PFL1_05961 [Pseudozyma flocculosa PF-1]SPO38363.1 uncharacterized protein PSFLO_03840 [Pseudozyma flocculosa]